jgi:hypothetical protein
VASCELGHVSPRMRAGVVRRRYMMT